MIKRENEMTAEDRRDWEWINVSSNPAEAVYVLGLPRDSRSDDPAWIDVTPFDASQREFVQR